MSNNTQTTSSSTRPGVGTRIKGVFETAHGIGENVRGRTLGAIDDMTRSGMPERTSHYTSLAERGRMEAETGMAHIYGDPDPNMGKPFHEGPGRMPYPTTGAPRTGHTSETGPGMGPTLTGQRGDVDGRTVRGGSGYGTDDRVGPSSGVQNVEQQPAIDRNTERVGPNTGGGSLSPNRGPPNTGSEQRMERDFPPDLPPRPQAQLTENNQRSGQMYQ